MAVNPSRPPWSVRRPAAAVIALVMMKSLMVFPMPVVMFVASFGGKWWWGDGTLSVACIL